MTTAGCEKGQSNDWGAGARQTHGSDSGLEIISGDPSRHGECEIGVLLEGLENRVEEIDKIHVMMIVITCQAQF